MNFKSASSLQRGIFRWGRFSGKVIAMSVIDLYMIDALGGGCSQFLTGLDRKSSKLAKLCSNHCECHLKDLLVWLAGRQHPESLSLLRQLLGCCAFALEQGPFKSNGSSDALADAPVPRASTRARRLDPLLAEAVAREAGTGAAARTGHKVALMMARFRKGGFKKLGKSTANHATYKRMSAYHKAAQAMFANGSHTRHVAFDATRMNGRDTLYCCLGGPEQQCCWCPPQVP